MLDTVAVDWIGRTVAITRPSPTESGNLTETREYNAQGHLAKIDFGTSAADQRFTYDSMGNIRLSGLDLNPGGLVLASTDRISETIRGYEKVGGKWWNVTTFRQYRTENNGSDVYTGVRRRAMKPVEVDGAARWESVTILPGGQTVTILRDVFFEDQTVVESSDSSSTSASPDSQKVVLGGLLISSSEYGTDHFTAYEYDPLRRVQKTIDPRGGITRIEYDGAGRVWRSIDHANNVTAYKYYGSAHKSAGSLWTVTNPEGETVTTTYDDQHRFEEAGGTGTYRVKYTYNSYGDLATHATTRNGSTWDITTWTSQEGTGLLKQKVYPGGDNTTYTYHDHGGANVRTWERGVTTTYSYNEALDLNGIDYSDGTPDVSLTPDRLGRIATITDGGGTMTRAYHSSLPVAETDTYSSGHAWLPGVVLTHTWDADDARRTDVGVNWGGAPYSTSAAYDPVTGRVASYTGSNTFKHEYAYAPGTSLITETSHFSGTTERGTETRHTDLAGRLSGIYTKNASGATTTRHGYTMDGAGRRTKAMRENAEYWEYDYNDHGEVTAGKKHLPSGNFLAGHQFEYYYDGIGNRTSSKSGGDAAGANLRTFGYTADARNQYDALTYPATFDVIGRSPVATGDSITSTLGTVTRQGEHYRVQGTAGNATGADWKAVDITYTPGGGAASVQNGHVFVPEGEVAPAYDEDGNLTRDGRWNYVWDAENRLVSMTTVHDDKPRTRILEFAYDWMGRRMQKTVTDEISSVMTVVEKRRFAYDGWNMTAEFTVGGGGGLAAERCYTWGTDLSGTERGAGGVGGLLSVADGDAPYISCYDGNGNIVAWMSGGGAVAGRRDYDPFGNHIIREGVGIPMGYSTKYEDDETELLYYGYRYYDAKEGRWLSRDPIGEQGGSNLYEFVNNSPVASLDPLGHKIFSSAGDSERYRNKLKAAFEELTESKLRWSLVKNSVGESTGRFRLCRDSPGTKGGLWDTLAIGIETGSSDQEIGQLQIWILNTGVFDNASAGNRQSYVHGVRVVVVQLREDAEVTMHEKPGEKGQSPEFPNILKYPEGMGPGRRCYGTKLPDTLLRISCPTPM